MAEQDFRKSDQTASQDGRADTKKEYEEPSFRFERVFETMALACGKIEPTNFQCRFHRKNS